MFRFLSANYDINLIKSYLLPVLIIERNMSTTVIKKANQFVSFKFGDVHFLVFMNIPGGASSLDSFPEAYKTSKTKAFFTYECFDCPKKVNNSELPLYDTLFSRPQKVNPLEKWYSDFQKLPNCGLKTEVGLSKMELSKPPRSGPENYHYLLDVWHHEKMWTFNDFLRWYNNKDLVPTLKAMHKRLDFITRKELTCWSSGVHFRIWQIIVCTNLPVPISTHLLER